MTIAYISELPDPMRHDILDGIHRAVAHELNHFTPDARFAVLIFDNPAEGYFVSRCRDTAELLEAVRALAVRLEKELEARS